MHRKTTKFFIIIIILSILCTVTMPYQKWRTLYQKITQESEYKQFYDLIRDNRIAKLNLLYQDLTLFVPENRAITNYFRDITEDMTFYHMSFTVQTLAQLNSSSSGGTNRLVTASEIGPLWITKHSNDIYVNDAKILTHRSNYIARTRDGPSGKNQVMHVIDRVLDPQITIPMQMPTALDFLRYQYKWRVGGEPAKIFYKKILQHGKQQIFSSQGGHTFFIPVDKKIDDFRKENIDSYIIDGHVIPHQVLFLRVTPRNFIYETIANGDFIYIVIDLVDCNEKDCVRSHTVTGNSNHRKGEMIVEILQANIPVANGVIHLISQPLAVFDRELKPFPYLSTFYKISSDPNLNLTHTVGELTGINKYLHNDSVIFTYFAPRDRAWGQYFRYSSDDFGEVLGRHLVLSTKRYTIEDLVDMSQKSNGTILNTVSGPIRFSFQKLKNDFWISWNGKDLRIARPNYQCTDGIVHILEEPFSHIENIVYDTTTVKDEEDEVLSFWGGLKNFLT